MTDHTTARDLVARIETLADAAVRQGEYSELISIAHGVRALAGAPTADVAATSGQWCNCQATRSHEGPWHPYGDTSLCPATPADEPETTARDLTIPPRAIVALVERGYEPDPGASGEQIAEDVRVIAAPVVAAELRRSADDLMYAGFGTAARRLRARADELEN